MFNELLDTWHKLETVWNNWAVQNESAYRILVGSSMLLGFFLCYFTEKLIEKL